MSPVFVMGALAGATVTFAWGAARFAEDERAWMQILGSLAMGVGALGFAAAVVMVLR